MASLADSIHSPHGMLASKERQGVNSMLLALKGIETRLRQHGHATTFSEDGIYLTYGEANVNCKSTLKVEQLLRAFKKRMNEEIEDDAKKTTAKKPRVRACTPILSPSDWQESNISRHATDGLGWDMKTVVTASKRQRVTSLTQPPADEERVNDKQDVASIPVSPDASKFANDGNTQDSVHEQIGEGKHEVAPLPLPPVAPRISDAWKMPEIMAPPPQGKPRVKLPPPVVKALLSEIDQTLCNIDIEPPTKDITEVHQDKPQEPNTPTYDHTPHVLIQQQQARIQVLEEELKQANAARLAAESRVQQLQDQAQAAQIGPRTRLGVQDLTEEISELNTKNRVMERKHDRLSKSFVLLQQEYVGHSRRLENLDRATARICQTIDMLRADRKVGIGAEDFTRVQNTVERHNNEWLPKLADRVSVMETDLKALWNALHDYAPSDSASGSSSPLTGDRQPDTPTHSEKDPINDGAGIGDALAKEVRDGTFVPCQDWSSLA